MRKRLVAIGVKSVRNEKKTGEKSVRSKIKTGEKSVRKPEERKKSLPGHARTHAGHVRTTCLHN